MLNSYSIDGQKNLFIVRSKIEGLCKWFEKKFPSASFINAGDGKHEHPTQELLDEYTFLERNDFNFDEIHIALLGDLKHGRTIHSKIDGLKIFKKVKLDLIAPKILQLPQEYLDKIDFEYEEFESIE